jgi:cytochrome c peroxidase
MKARTKRITTSAVFVAALIITVALTYAKPSSYAPVVITEDFQSVMTRMTAAKPEIMKRQMDLLHERYDLSDSPAQGVTMSRGKLVQQGVRAKLPDGMTWQKLAEMIPDEIRTRGLFPKGFMPLPHPNHREGGMVFPQFVIDEIKKLEDRDLTRFGRNHQQLLRAVQRPA